MYAEGSLTHTHGSTMDRECVSLLPGVCEVLADSGSSLPDDTSLEKLLDWFTGLTKAGGSLLEECPCLLEFISAVVHNTASDPGVLSFALKLAGLMASTENGFKMLQEGDVLDLVFNLKRWQEARLWEDPCLRIGWIQGLKNSLQHPKALSFFVKSDFIEPLLQLQTDTSLFVASAANQMLAHILLFFQPVSSAGSNGVDKKEEDDGRAQTSIRDLKHPAVTMDTAAEYSPVVTAISEYLKESLVPKESAQLHQSLQVLKLLALLLAQAGPPLRDKLLQAVADSLEELVTAGCSQLTLPLMDVILAAHSSGTVNASPTQPVTPCYHSMLNINKPPDLIPAAAACLRRGHRDTVHTPRVVKILLLPLDIITGQPLLGADTTADEHRFSVSELLKSKTSCISVICVCLTNTPQITLTPPEDLPCPPAAIVTAVLSLLRICSGVSSSSSSSSTGCSEVCRNVIGSGKVQKCALEALAALSSSSGAKEEISEVFTVLIQYLDTPDSDPTVLHKSYQALLKWMSVCTDLSLITDPLRQDLVEVVKKRVCDMRWEVRDSTVEFLGHLAGVGKSAEDTCDASEALLDGCCIAPLLKEALQDTESYVRASAISALAKTLAHSWQQGAALSQEETEIVSRLLEILSKDTEGFSRRAVVQYFIAWFSSRHSQSSPSTSLLAQSVRSVLSHGSADLDWEVKVYTLELAELLLDEAFSGQRGYRRGSDTRTAVSHPYGVVSDQPYTLHTHSGSHTEGAASDLARALSDLVEQRVISALLSGLVDCDRPVGLKACRLLITLRETVCPLSLGALDAAAATVAKVSCELPGWGWGMEIRKILGMKKSDGTRGADIAVKRSLNGAEEVDREDCGVLEEGGDGAIVGVCEALTSLGLDERLDVLTQSSDHIHNSPLSLLQDILTASAAHTQPHTQPGQEVIVDCY
ncbi:LOW QUALITY PROTEIN: BRCA1-associated ATM activator 1 [Morone saxatilis]|uniref:LOW QUALITY PROTEIN: BRCA1-associated ATM activator 1 n=1 Tax=Morone saxatilis TaxID=34816 RepID=UPI0015E22429|nr:LOW QUALITY PROTEIN: BRCA1-associated ATM activator 1 [Morone saxatilis]